MPVPPLPVAVKATVWPASTIAGFGEMVAQIVPPGPVIGVQGPPEGGGGAAPVETAAESRAAEAAETLAECELEEAAATEGPDREFAATGALAALEEKGETAPLGDTVTVIGAEVAVVVAALFDAEAAAEEEDAEELGLERIRMPVLNAASGLVIPLAPTVPGVAIGTAVAWTAYPPGPPLDGRTVATAGAIAKPTNAISPTTSTHHVRERSAFMTTRVASAPRILKLRMLSYTFQGRRPGSASGPPPGCGVRRPARAGWEPPLASDRLPGRGRSR